MSDGNVTTYEFVALAPFDVATRNDMLLWFNTNKTNMKLLEIVGVEERMDAGDLWALERNNINKVYIFVVQLTRLRHCKRTSLIECEAGAQIEEL